MKYVVHSINTHHMKSIPVTVPMSAEGVNTYLWQIYRRHQTLTDMARWMNVGWCLTWRTHGILYVYHALPVIQADSEPSF